MKQFLDRTVPALTTACVAVILALVPFHAFLTVWGSSFLGHYTALRLWEEALLMLATAGVSYLLLTDRAFRSALVRSWLWRFVGLYAAVQLIWGAAAYHAGSVGAKALAYGLLINLRFLLFFLVVWAVAGRYGWLRRQWPRLVLIPAAIVMVIGLSQRFVLPHDFLRHFGYGDKTIAPFETIDHKVQYLRIQSTLRGANLLGAYMIIVLSVVLSRLRRYWLTAGMLVGLVVLFLSGSRGAWLGAVIAVALLLFLEVPGRRNKQLILLAGALLAVIGAGTVFALRHNDTVENTFFHTDNHSRSRESSNAAHFSASRAAARQVWREPLGRGPGTAGPASVYNTKEPPRIAENYFLQIAQETGWLGLILFAAIYVMTGRQLWLRRSDPLARSLFAALLGLTVVALLMHIWADETITFLFWGLSGLALAPSLAAKRVKTRETDA